MGPDPSSCGSQSPREGVRRGVRRSFRRGCRQSRQGFCAGFGFERCRRDSRSSRRRSRNRRLRSHSPRLGSRSPLLGSRSLRLRNRRQWASCAAGGGVRGPGSLNFSPPDSGPLRNGLRSPRSQCRLTLNGASSIELSCMKAKVLATRTRIARPVNSVTGPPFWEAKIWQRSVTTSQAPPAQNCAPPSRTDAAELPFLTSMSMIEPRTPIVIVGVRIE